MFHCSIKTISRSTGRNAAGACAYVSAGVAADPYTWGHWTGRKPKRVFDYGKKAKPVAVEYCNTSAATAADFALALDSKETRRNSAVAREVIVALPDSVTDKKRLKIARETAADMAARWDVPVMFAVHRPDRRGDSRNQHVHFIMGTRNSKGEKVRVLDVANTARVEVEWMRQQVAFQIKKELPEIEASKWSPDSFKDREITEKPTKHEGPLVTAMRRRGVLMKYAKENDEIKEPKPLFPSTRPPLPSPKIEPKIEEEIEELKSPFPSTRPPLPSPKIEPKIEEEIEELKPLFPSVRPPLPSPSPKPEPMQKPPEF